MEVESAIAAGSEINAARHRAFELVLGIGDRALSTYVGRASELDLVRQKLALTLRGQGRLVGIRGEPGVGKSRFLYEISRELLAAELTYLAGRCLSYASAVPYLPIVDIVRQQCDIDEHDREADVLLKVHAALTAAGLDGDGHLPYVMHMLGLNAGVETLRGLGPEVIKSRSLESLRQLTLGASRRRPVVILIEDLQWIDPSSEEYLLTLARRIAQAPILILASFRPEYHPGWSGEPWASEIILERLSREESLRLYESNCHQDARLAARTQEILDRAEGNPLFLEELAAAIDDTTATMVVPDTIFAVLAARIDRLSVTEQRLLTAAAVLGKDVSAPLLRDLAALQEPAFSEALVELERAGLLYLRRDSGGVAEYTFKHALTQQAAYQRLEPQERQALHAQAVAAIEADGGDPAPAHLELLAHHAEMAGMWDKAVRCLGDAGRRSIERSAHLEAIAQLTRALGLLPQLAAARERDHQEIELRIALGVPLAVTRGYSHPEVERNYARARELSARVGDPARSFPAVYGLWRFCLLRADYSTARQLSEQLLALATRADETNLLVQAHRAAGATSFYLGELEGARAHCEKVWTYEALPERRAQLLANDVVDPWVASAAYRAWSLWLLGRGDEARGEIEAAISLARQLAHPFSIALALSFASWLDQFDGDAAAVQVHIDEALEGSEEHNFRFWIGWGLVMRAWVRLEQGDGRAAVDLMRQGLADWQATGSQLGQTYFLGLLSQAYSRLGDAQAASDTLAAAQTFAAASGETWWQAELHRLEGELHCASGRSADGRACLHRALEVARSQGAVALEQRARASLSRMDR